MFIKSSLYGVLTLLSTTSAFALSCVNDYGGSSSCAGSTQAAGDCTTLGYFKNNVDGCEHYLYCPFDTAYKRCVSLDCTTYTLSSCPSGATSCSSCQSGSSTKYKINGCKSGYVVSVNTCVDNPCTGFDLTSCPANGFCSSCLSGTANKYKLNSCSSEYKLSGDSCVCATTCKDTATVPANATAVKETCTACGVDTEIITGFTCNDGYVKSGNSCVAATCGSYGYTSTKPSTGTICADSHFVKLGASTGTCYSGCTSCESLGIFFSNPVSFCKRYRGACYRTYRTAISGYPYGDCLRIYSTDCVAHSASRCTSILDPGHTLTSCPNDSYCSKSGGKYKIEYCRPKCTLSSNSTYCSCSDNQHQNGIVI